MAKGTCSVAECDRAAYARTYYSVHYQRVNRTGRPGPAAINTPRRHPAQCSIEACARPAAARGLCNTHYERWRRNGDTSLTTRTVLTCRAPECENQSIARGYCTMHYARVRKHGDPEVVKVPNWSGDDVDYPGVHARLRQRFGSARKYPCRRCGNQATQWAFDHTDPNPRFSAKGRPFSVDLNRYIPLCRSCHARLDWSMAKGRQE